MEGREHRSIRGTVVTRESVVGHGEKGTAEKEN